MKRAFILLAVAWLSLSGCSPNDDIASKETPIRPVLYAKAMPMPAESNLFAGEIVPRVSSALGFRILGQLTARNVSVGDIVEAGAVLAMLDATQLQQSRDIAVAQLASAEAQLENASGSEERLRALLQQGTISQANYDAAKQALDAAQANADSARANLDKANDHLSYSQLTAEFEGIVTAVGAEIGQTVAAGQMIVTVARTGEREAVIDVPAELVARYQVGTAFDIVLQTLPDVVGRGLVREIAPAADPLTRTTRLKLELVDPPTGFRLGSTIVAKAQGTGDLQIRLPLAALREEDGGESVWIVDPDTGKVNLRAVEVIERGADWFSPGSEIADGELVVTAGVHSLAEGQSVVVDGVAP